MYVKLQQVAWPPVLVFHGTLFFSRNDTDRHDTEKFPKHKKQGMKAHPRNCPCRIARAQLYLGHTYHDRWALVTHVPGGFLSSSIGLSLFFIGFSRKIITFTWYTYFRSDPPRVLAICHRIHVLCKHWRGRGSSAHPWPRCWQSLNKCYQWCSQRGL